LTDIYVDGDACPVREEIYRVAARLRLNVFVVSNGSRPIRPPGTPNVRMVLVDDSADAADDWIAEHITAVDLRVTSDFPLASRCLKIGARRLPDRKMLDASQYRRGAGRSETARHLRELGTNTRGPAPLTKRDRPGSSARSTRLCRLHCARRPGYEQAMGYLIRILVDTS